MCDSPNLIAAEAHGCVSLHSRRRRELDKNLKGAVLSHDAGQIAELEDQPSERRQSQYHKNAHDEIAPPLAGLVVTHYLLPFRSVRPSMNSSLIARKG